MTEELMKHGEIQSFDHEGGPDWALAPPKLCCELDDNIAKFLEEQMKVEPNTHSISEALSQLERDWNKKNLTVEIAAGEANRNIVNKWERDIQEYSLSSSHRRRFLMYAIRAAYDEVPISWKQLIKLLNISRNALDTMANECVGAGWVIENAGDKRVDSTFIAAESLIITYDNYSAWVRRSCKNLGIRTTASAIIELQALVDTEFAKKHK